MKKLLIILFGILFLCGCNYDKQVEPIKDNIKIIDYKLKNISDEAYLKQLNGYKDYIENRFNKPTNIYLYSVTNNTLEKI